MPSSTFYVHNIGANFLYRGQQKIVGPYFHSWPPRMLFFLAQHKAQSYHAEILNRRCVVEEMWPKRLCRKEILPKRRWLITTVKRRLPKRHCRRDTAEQLEPSIVWGIQKREKGTTTKQSRPPQKLRCHMVRLCSRCFEVLQYCYHFCSKRIDITCECK